MGGITQFGVKCFYEDLPCYCLRGWMPLGLYRAARAIRANRSAQYQYRSTGHSANQSICCLVLLDDDEWANESAAGQSKRNQCRSEHGYQWCYLSGARP